MSGVIRLSLVIEIIFATTILLGWHREFANSFWLLFIGSNIFVLWQLSHYLGRKVFWVSLLLPIEPREFIGTFKIPEKCKKGKVVIVFDVNHRFYNGTIRIVTSKGELARFDLPRHDRLHYMMKGQSRHLRFYFTPQKHVETYSLSISLATSISENEIQALLLVRYSVEVFVFAR